jgi:hypothetical protein
MSITVNGTTGLNFPDGTSQPTAGFVPFRNKIINGDMRIDQRRSGSSVTLTTADNNYTLDRFRFFITQSSKFSIQQVLDAPAGFSHSAKCTVVSAYTPSVTNDQFFYGTSFEGNMMTDLAWGTAAAKSATFSFWVKSSIAGKYAVSFVNDPNTRTYVATYNINSANTWEYKTITIAGDTSGTWTNYGNARNMFISFMLGTNSSMESTTPNTWTSNNHRATADSIDLVTTNGASWQITGVQFETGSGATSFEGRPYQTELSLCQRYYEINGNMYVRNTGASAAEMRITWVFKTEKRSDPTIIVGTGASTGVNKNCATVFQSNIGAGQVCDTSAQLIAVSEI